MTVDLVTRIAAFEGFSAKSYPDPASPRAIAMRKKQPYEHLSGAPWTIGFGETLGIAEGMTWTREHALERLGRRVAGFRAQVAVLIPNATKNQIDACTSLAYNIGMAAFKASSVCRLTKRGEYAQAAEKFLLWNKAGGRVYAGLTARRLQERALYLTP